MPNFARAIVHGELVWGIVEGDVFRRIVGSPYDTWDATFDTRPMASLVFGPPCVPQKIVLVSGNYPVVIDAYKKPERDWPWIHMKPGSGVIGPGHPIMEPGWSSGLQHEAELAVVVGKHCRNIEPADAPKVILGYTCLNDVSASDKLSAERVVTRSRSFDTFTPIGPWVATDIEPSGRAVRSLVNGEVRIQANTGEMKWSAAEIVSFVSKTTALAPGDIISTGAADIGPIAVGDTVTIEIEGIGSLTNVVVADRGVNR